MKRFTIFITLLVLSVMQMTAQDTSIKGTITLSHQGKTTGFAYNKMTNAISCCILSELIKFKIKNQRIPSFSNS